MLQALIDSRVLCVHGGLSPDLRTLDQVHLLLQVRLPHRGRARRAKCSAPTCLLCQLLLLLLPPLQQASAPSLTVLAARCAPSSGCARSPTRAPSAT